MYGYLGLLMAFMYLSVRLSRIKRTAGGEARTELSPVFFYVAALIFYGLAMPVSRVLFGSPGTDWDVSFVAMHALAAGGLLLGILFSKVEGFYARETCAPADGGLERPGEPYVVTAMLLANGLFYFSWLRDAQYDVSAVFLRYGAEAASYTEATILSTALGVLTTCSVWAAYYVNVYRREGRPRNRPIVLAVGAILCLFYTLRGNRNQLLILALPILVMSLRRRPVSLAKLAVCGVLAWVSLYTVGIIRNWGFGNLADVTFSREAYDPLAGEFGTLYSVYDKAVTGSLGQSELLLGSSYTVDLALNLVPRQFWPDRPLTAAQVASVTYYGKFGFGIGFSPVVEAIFNFGGIGVVPLFFLISVLASWLEKVCDGRGAWCSVYYGALAPMLINFWRIDFATIFKMGLVYGGGVWLILRLSRRGLRSARPVAQ